MMPKVIVLTFAIVASASAGLFPGDKALHAYPYSFPVPAVYSALPAVPAAYSAVPAAYSALPAVPAAYSAVPAAYSALPYRAVGPAVYPATPFRAALPAVPAAAAYAPAFRTAALPAAPLVKAASFAAPVVAPVAAPAVAAPVAAPLAVAPVAAAKLDYADVYPQYQYGYNIQDTLTGDSKAQEEVREGGVVKGRYSLIEADGSRRTVSYYADPLNGFNAVVQKDLPVVAAPVAPVVKAAPAIVSV